MKDTSEAIPWTTAANAMPMDDFKRARQLILDGMAAATWASFERAAQSAALAAAALADVPRFRPGRPLRPDTDGFTLAYLGQAIAVAMGLGQPLAEIMRLLRQLADAAEGITPAPWRPSDVAQIELLRLQELGIASRAELAAEGLQLDPLGGLLSTPAELWRAALAVMRRKFPASYAAESQAWQLGRLITGGVASEIRADAGRRLAEAVRQSRRMGRKKIRRHLRRLEER